jgi:HEAT repeat protein
MAKSRGVDAKLKRLQALCHEPATPAVIAELRKALDDASNLVAAEAAEIAGALHIADLNADLVAAFERFMIEPDESDKHCRAKTAIVEALNKLEYDREDVFLQGIRHVQNEGWGGHEDAAAQLRGSCAFGLVRINYGDALIFVADLLADPTKTARAAAAQALGASGARAAIPLLRFKARTGDADPSVVADCLTALMNLAPKESLAFVAEFLHAGNEALQEGAALALAESRRPEALEILKDFWPNAGRGSIREVVLLAISMLRLPAGFDFLLAILGGSDSSMGRAALDALAIHRHNEALKDRVAAVIGSKNDNSLTARFQQKFAERH